MQLNELENGHNPKVIAIGSAGHINGFTTEEFTEAITNLAIAFGEAVEVVQNAFNGLINWFEESKDNIIDLFGSIENFLEKIEEREHKREFHKLDFTRKKIVHQVMCRKPKHLVKKIIH